MATFQIFKNIENKYSFNLKLDSGNVVLTSSEPVTDKLACEKQIELVKANAKFAHRFSRLSAPEGSYFILKDADHRILGSSDHYTYWLDMERSIAAIRSYAYDARVEDLSTAHNKAAALDLV